MAATMYILNIIFSIFNDSRKRFHLNSFHPTTQLLYDHEEMFFLDMKYAAVQTKKRNRIAIRNSFFYIKSISYKVIKEKDK